MAISGLPLLLCVLVATNVFGDELHQEVNIVEYRRMMQLRHLAVEFFDFYENITTTDLTGSRLPSQEDLKCLAEMSQLSLALRSGSIWALRMIDSWGRLPSGILYGNLKDLGNYDECLRVNHAIATSGQNLRGKYCFAKLISGSMMGPDAGALSGMSISTAVCFPAACSGQNIDTLLRRLFQQLLSIEISTETQLVDESTCQTAQHESWDALTIVTIVIIALLGAIVLLCTLYDYFLCQDQSNLPVLLKIFSARANSRSLFRIVDSKANPNVIDCLHGIRCMSLIWVVYGHDYIMSFQAPNINLVDLWPWYTSSYSMLIVHGLFSVDSFFFLSGLLVVMVALRSMERSHGRLNVPLMYLHRFLRLTPVLGLAILVYMSVLPIMGSGPVSSGYLESNVKNCKETWYLTLLYVQNYAAGMNDMCMMHSWYLGVDTQLYVISPIFLFVLYKWNKKAVAGIVVLMLLLTACLISMMAMNDFSTDVAQRSYFETHVRAAPWLIGILFGYFLHVNRGKSFKLNRLTVWLGWIISLSLIFTCLFALYPNSLKMVVLDQAFYTALTRIAWPLALVWIVFACKYGYGGLANSFLSSPLWQPLSKISYCVYIWHPFIQNIHGGNQRTSTYFSDYQVMLRFWSDFGFTLLFAFLMYILIEAPSGGLQWLWLPAKQPVPKIRPSAPLEKEAASEMPTKIITNT